MLFVLRGTKYPVFWNYEKNIFFILKLDACISDFTFLHIEIVVLKVVGNQN